MLNAAVILALLLKSRMGPVVISTRDFINNFVEVFCGDEPEVKRGKPYPDPYLFTMNKYVVFLKNEFGRFAA